MRMADALCLLVERASILESGSVGRLCQPVDQPMVGTRNRLALTASVDEALEAPWAMLNHLATGDPAVRSQALDDYEDAGRTEDRVRHDYTGRYPIELLQNAHDACADGHRQGVVRFAVTPTALLVANEG